MCGLSKDERHGLIQLFRADQSGQPLAESAIADLIMVLGEEDGGLGRQMRARLAARRVMQRKDFALIGEALGQGPREMLQRLVGEGAIIAFVLARQQDVQRVVEIVAPLRVIIAASAR